MERKLADMRRQVKFTLQDANRVEQETEVLKGDQQSLIEALEERRANCNSLQRTIDQLDAELSQLSEQREKVRLWLQFKSLVTFFRFCVLVLLLL